jgi:rubrerythrin
MKVFNGHDVLQFAIRVEENGEAFYREAARLANDQGVRDLFSRLAAEEVGHRRTFEGMLSELGSYQPAETYEGEYLSYLHAYIDGKAIFRGNDIGSSGPANSQPAAGTANLSALNVHDTLSALDYAIQREIDSIVYYQEVRVFVPEKYYPVVDGIIGEERRHFSLLSGLRRGPL